MKENFIIEFITGDKLAQKGLHHQQIEAEIKISWITKYLYIYLDPNLFCFHYKFRLSITVWLKLRL